MATIEGFRIENYRMLKDVTLGKLWTTGPVRPLRPLTTVIGKNGVGKSTIFDALGFLADALKSGVEEACDSRGRGGIRRLRSQGQDEPIRFEMYYRQRRNSRPITYELSIDERHGRPFVSSDRLRQRRKGQRYGRPLFIPSPPSWPRLCLEGRRRSECIRRRRRHFWKRNSGNDAGRIGREGIRRARRCRSSRNRTLGSLRQHPRIAAFRRFIENWYLSYFTPDAARDLPLAGPQKHLNMHGDNLGNVVQFMQRQHPERFRSILKRIAEKIPGIEHIDTEQTPDGRLLLRFNDRGFKDPFFAQQMSDGTLKVFACLLLLEDPAPPPFLCIEEPENGLYHKLLEALAQEFRSHATGRKGGSQVFITTHQPYFVDALDPEEVWILKKRKRRVRQGSARQR